MTVQVATIPRFAQGLGVTGEAIRQRFARANVQPVTTIDGVPAYALDSIPLEMRAQMACKADEQGFRNLESMLNGEAPASAWKPAVPFAEARPVDRDVAEKLCKVLQPFLAPAAPKFPTEAQRDAAIALAHQKAFGRAAPLSSRQIRHLVNRTVERDGGRNDFSNVELYLPENAAPAPKPRAADAYDHSALAARLFFQSAHPGPSESQNAFDYSFHHYEALCQRHPGQRQQIKKSILDSIVSLAPGLSASRASLERNWNRKYARWENGGRVPSAIADLRPVNSGNRNPLDAIEADIQLLVAEAFKFDGKLSIAYRKLRRENKLGQEFLSRYTLDLRRNKSYIPPKLRQELTARLRGMLEHRRSKWAVNMAGPRIARDHSCYEPGDWFAADDVTWNIYFWTLDDHGRPILTRGECIVFFDCRSLYPLGYLLVPGHFNGETVRRAKNHIHDKHGFPHRGFLLEKGIFASRLIAGEHLTGFLGWDEYEMGLRERGLAVELRHATTPQGKLIEGLFNILQQNQRNQRGFVGFNEKAYGQEKLQRLIGRVKRGLVHPSEEFYSMEEWGQALDRSFEIYANEPQNGKLLRGLSPAEKWAEHKPLRKLNADERYLLASHRVRATVREDGLSITIRGNRRHFYSDDLAQLRGREVEAWFNVEAPDLLTVSSLDRKKFLSLEYKELPAFAATKEQLKDASSQRHAFMLPAKQRVDQIKHTVRRSITRDDNLAPDDAALFAHIRERTERHHLERSADKRKLAHITRLADSIGLPIPENPRHLDSVQTGLEILSQSYCAEEPADNHERIDSVVSPTANPEPSATDSETPAAAQLCSVLNKFKP